ncbi:oxidoreductase [Lithospermum erythrorhizon]|uniref:Oxidoreductase n=1 Tax=Lithospermum erythrorhizon TaxID=34254 RepID=A0AAV3NNY6_LITER
MTINGEFRRNHVVNWRDTLACTFLDDDLDPEDVPPVCRKEVFDYLENMVKVRGLLAEGLSEALGLDKDFLDGIECMKSKYFLCLYYPASPEPELTFGSFRHQDATFMTAVLQDNMGGLQVLYQDNWIDVKPIQGALVINIGQLMQLITNDKFKCVEHRVVSSYNGPRLSIACFFTPSSGGQMKSYGPIKDLLFETNPQIYKEVPYADYINFHQIKIRERIPILPFFKVRYNEP